MYHEIFHQYQFRARWVIHGVSEPPNEIVFSREFQRLAADAQILEAEGGAYGR